MLSPLSVVTILLLSTRSLSSPSNPATGTPTASSLHSNPTVCGDIVNSNDIVFNASTVYECLTSVPFNPAVATRLIRYYNDTLQFQSTLAYLESPPAGYQQPPTDLIAGLGRIQEDIDNGRFPNEYSFEATLQNLIYSAHDSHLQLVAGVLAAFTFSSPYEIASVSIDGIQLPKVYMAYDLIANQTPSLTWAPSPISTINDQPVVEYLSQFAAVNSVGGLEPHTDWNMLMQSFALDIQGYYETFAGSATFFPGNTITYEFENKSVIGPLPYLALYNSQHDTGPLATGQDFYDFFVLGLSPDSDFDEQAPTAATSSGTVVDTITQRNLATNSATPTSSGWGDLLKFIVLGLHPGSYLDKSTVAESSSASVATSTQSSLTTTSSTPTPTGWDSPAYPSNPDIAQEDLAVDGGGFLSGYFLNHSSIAVLSIPSFDEFGEALGTFSDTIATFITRSQQAGLKKVVIDLQQNSRGSHFLAIDTFEQFFPTTAPFGGSRRSAHPMADVLGSTMTSFWETLASDDEDYNSLSTDEWILAERLNAVTDHAFSSWSEYFGPNFTYNGGAFSSVERYNLSSYFEASGNIDVFDDNQLQPPYAAEDIILLTDGLCASSCSLFMEMMHHQAGVRTVVAGGRPSYGPMQSPGESRGARMYSVDVMDADIAFAQAVNDSALPPALPNRTIDHDFDITLASINLRDQIRQRENIPLQFVYEAADCRIFYTPQTWYNYTALWQYAADAIWTDPKLCVKGSTGFTTTAGNTSQTSAPPSTDTKMIFSSNMTGITLSGTPDKFPANMGGEIASRTAKPKNSTKSVAIGATCKSNSTCHNHMLCLGPFSTGCNKTDSTMPTKKQCVLECSSNRKYQCPPGQHCLLNGTKKKGSTALDYRTGYCTPSVPKDCKKCHGKTGVTARPKCLEELFY